MSVNKVKFRLSSPSKNRSSIRVEYHDSRITPNKRVEAGTGIVVDTKQWDKVKRYLRNSRAVNHERRVLENIENAIVEHVRNCIEYKKPLRQADLKNAIEIAKGKGIQQSSEEYRHQDFIPFFMEILSQEMKPNTIKSYKGTYHRLLRFQKEYKSGLKYPLGWSNLNDVFKKDYMKWSREYFKDGTIWNDIKNAKAIVNRARSQGIIESQEASFSIMGVSEIKNAKSGSDHVILSQEEILRIKDLDLKNTAGKMELARDFLILQLETALRVSDLMKINQEAFKTLNGVLMLFIHQTKTGEPVAIPVHPWVYDWYMEKLKGRSLSDVIYNLRIKKVLGIAGIDRSEEFTSHDARRTFAVNALRSGMAPHHVMVFTGHTSIKTLETYIGGYSYLLKAQDIGKIYGYDSIENQFLKQSNQ